MDAPSQVVEAVREVLPDGKLLVALSGGADSGVAAWACIEVAGAGRVRLVHIDHGLPGSPMMRAAANLVAAELGLPLRVLAVDISGAGSEETRARIARMAALDAVADDDEWIVTGHHRDDAAETVLGNLLRGAGAAGLSGIAARRDRYVRPLLALPGVVIRDAADTLRLPYRDDPANADLRHQRNVVRHRLLPGLEASLGSDVRGALQRTARILGADDALLETQADVVPILMDAGGALLPASVLTTVARPVAARAVRRALRLVRPPYPGSAAEVASVFDVAAGATRRQLLDGWHAVREGPYVAVVPDLDLPPVDSTSLAIPGTAHFGHGHVLTGTVASRSRPHPIGRERTILDTDVTGDRFDVRCAEQGERIDVGVGSKSVRDALAEADVPVRHRATWPVVAVRGRIAWIPGVRTAVWAQAGRTSGPMVALHWERTRG